MTDHPFPTQQWLDSGGHHTLDPLVALAFAAAATTTLLLHTNCYIPAYRNPYVSAKGVATLDAISGGRVIFGVAVGYLEEEFDALGASFRDRGVLLDRAIEQMKLAWTSDLVERNGDDVKVAGNVSLPHPARRPHPPIWIGGNSRAAMRRAVEYGDGWIPFPARAQFSKNVRTVDMSDIEQLRLAIEEARALAEATGRTDETDVCFTPFGHPHHRDRFEPEAFVEEARALAAVGVTWLSLHLPSPTKEAFLENVEIFGRDAVAHVRDL